MAKDINTVTICGRLTRDAELKYTTSGTAVSKISVACNDRKKSGNNWIDEVSYFDCVLWGKMAEGLNPYLTKGQQVGIAGRLAQNRWENDGQKHSKIEIKVSDIQLLGGKKQQQASSAPVNDDMPDFDDDIPF